MGVLDAMKRSSVPPLDPRVDEIAYDETLSLESRLELLDQLFYEPLSSNDRQNLMDQYAVLELRRRAREYNRRAGSESPEDLTFRD